MYSKYLSESAELTEELKKEYGAVEFYSLGKLQENEILNADRGVVYDLNVTLACIIRDYLRLYNKENLKASCPTVYEKVICQNTLETPKENDYDKWNENLNKWTEEVEKTAVLFDKLIKEYDSQNQEAVDKAFNALKKIFLGLWT